MKTKNLTPFPFGTKVTSRRPPRPEMTLVLRAAYVLAPGRPLAVPAGPSMVAQGPMSADTYRDDDAERAGECLYPGDFADWKPRADLMLRGTCHTPFGKPLAECPVRFSVGRWSKILRVSGRRFWSDDKPGAVMSETAPFTKMPVDYAHAFGGPGYAPNPAGLGFAGLELPNVEHAGNVVRARRDDHGPAGFGPHNPAWPQRAPKVGKEYGPRWKKERSPYYSEDFDWTYFNAAPADQQLDGYLRGDERVVFQNLHPTEQVFETALPGLRIRAFVKDDKARFREVTMRLDTLFADLDEGRLYLTWRGLDAIETDDRKDVLWALVASEPLADAPLPEAHYREVLDAFEADPLEIKARVPAEMLRQAGPDEGPPAGPGRGPPRLAPRRAAARSGDGQPARRARRAPARAVRRQGAGGAGRRRRGERRRLGAAAGRHEGADRPRRQRRRRGQAEGQGRSRCGRAGRRRPPRRRPSRRPSTTWRGRRRSRRAASSPKRRSPSSPGWTRQVEAMKNEPFFQAILSRPAYQDPGPGKDLHGQDYEGRDLRGRRPPRRRTSRTPTSPGPTSPGPTSRGPTSTAAVLCSADLTGADFTGADLTLANLTAARAPGATFSRDDAERGPSSRRPISRAPSSPAPRGTSSSSPRPTSRGADCRETRRSSAPSPRAPCSTGPTSRRRRWCAASSSRSTPSG